MGPVRRCTRRRRKEVTRKTLEQKELKKLCVKVCGPDIGLTDSEYALAAGS
jgi:predicted secreted protein